MTQAERIERIKRKYREIYDKLSEIWAEMNDLREEISKL